MVSASEKLKALGPPFDLTETHSWVDLRDDGSMVNVRLALAILDALPQIVAVVEAAERLDEFPNEVTTGCTCSFCSLTRALAALDKALS